MVRFIYTFVIGILFLNLQAYAMVDDMELDPARAVRSIEKVDDWNTFGKDFAEMFRQNRTFFALGLKLDTGVLNTFQSMCAMCPSREEFDAFDKIEQELFRNLLIRGDVSEGSHPDIVKAYREGIIAEDKYKAQKAERLAEGRQRRLAEEENNRRIAALSEKDNFITNVGKRIASFMKFCPRSTPDFAEL
jgi:hypothetical protein